MTEIGMALSNPLEGDRMEGCVGKPLPGVQARIDGLEKCLLKLFFFRFRFKNVARFVLFVFVFFNIFF